MQLSEIAHQLGASPDGKMIVCVHCGRTLLQCLGEPVCAKRLDKGKIRSRIFYQEDFDQLAQPAMCPECNTAHPRDEFPSFITSVCHPGHPVFLNYLPESKVVMVACSVCRVEICRIAVSEGNYEMWKAEQEDEQEEEVSGSEPGPTPHLPPDPEVGPDSLAN